MPARTDYRVCTDPRRVQKTYSHPFQRLGTTVPVLTHAACRIPPHRTTYPATQKSCARREPEGFAVFAQLVFLVCCCMGVPFRGFYPRDRKGSLKTAILARDCPLAVSAFATAIYPLAVTTPRLKDRCGRTGRRSAPSPTRCGRGEWRRPPWASDGCGR